mmetsp:Transcript_18734/g.39272  ORF Transcript_18734/g.39272 Transcript_18734/m.39272 type:complete len:270 (+) Transcript_18734:188-997(+)
MTLYQSSFTHWQISGRRIGSNAFLMWVGSCFLQDTIMRTRQSASSLSDLLLAECLRILESSSTLRMDFTWVRTDVICSDPPMPPGARQSVDIKPIAEDLDRSPPFLALSCFSLAFTMADDTFDRKSTTTAPDAASASSSMELLDAKTSTPADAAETVNESRRVKHSIMSTRQFSSRSLNLFTRAPATVAFLSEFFLHAYSAIHNLDGSCFVASTTDVKVRMALRRTFQLSSSSSSDMSSSSEYSSSSENSSSSSSSSSIASSSSPSSPY